MTLVFAIAALMSMLAAAIVSGFETGVYALSHIRLRYRLSLGDARAKAVDALLANPQQLLTGVLLAQNAAVYFTTAVVAAILEQWGLGRAEAYGTVALAVVFFIFVEAAPKNVFRRAADVLVYPLARPLGYLIAAMRPAGFVLNAITRLASRLAARTEVSDPFLTRDRLVFYLREGVSEGILSDYQVQLAHNILRGEKVTVARAMVPLEKAAMIPHNATADELRQLLRANRFSRYPVYRGAKEAVVGVINIYDTYLEPTQEFDMEALVRPATFLPVDLRVTEAIKSLLAARQVLGIVSDKDRAIGIVTLKDCLEEIVGELYAW